MEEEREAQEPAQPRLESLARSVRRLTIAVSVLIVLMLALFVLPWVWYYVRAQLDVHQQQAESGEASQPYGTPDEELNSFHDLLPDEKIRRASAILLTKVQIDGSRVKEIVSEVVKRAPGVSLYYGVGDELEHMSHTLDPSCKGCEGEGQVVFMGGNPAQMASSYSFTGDRIGGMGGMPLERLRKMAKESEAQGGPSGSPPVRQR